MAVLEVEDSGYYVVCFNGRSDNTDYNAVNFRHILINATDENEDGEYSAEELTVAEDKINEIYDEWVNGDATEESFAELANANSEDSGSNTNGGLYEHVGKNSMVDVVNDFIFDPNTQPGDTTIVLNEGSYTGYHLIYFVGPDEMSYHDCLADYGTGSVEGLRQPDYTACTTSSSALLRECEQLHQLVCQGVRETKICMGGLRAAHFSIGGDNVRERTKRTEMLLGAEAMERLRAAHVVVFGLGGVGSWCAEALARSGVGSSRWWTRTRSRSPT